MTSFFTLSVFPSVIAKKKNDPHASLLTWAPEAE